MRAPSAFVLVTLLAAAGCRESNVATFTRQVPAAPPTIVGAAVATFSSLAIPVEIADEPGGRVKTSAVNLRGSLGTGSPEERVQCSPLAGDSAAARDTTPVMASFEVRVKPVRDGSLLSLEMKREKGDSRCAVKSSFLSQLLDQITQGARRS